MKIVGKAVRSLFILSVVSVLIACSDNPEDTEIARPNYSPPVETGELSKVVLAGAGLPGLQSFDSSIMLPAEELNALFSAAYGGRAPGTVTVTANDGAVPELLDAQPYVAFRNGAMLVLLVTHVNAQDCHACAGRTSVFYFNAADKSLAQSFPLSIQGNDWGEPQDMQLVKLPDGNTAGLFKWGGGNQGYFCGGYQIIRFGDNGVELAAKFPSEFDDTSATGTASVGLSGVGPGPGGNSLQLRFSGKTQDDDGNMKPINEDRKVTLDGHPDAWIDDWPYVC